VESFKMTDFDEFERRLAVALRSDADQGTAGSDPIQVARAAIAAARRPVRLARRRWTRPMFARLALVAAVGALTVGAGLYLAVGGPTHSPAFASPSPSSGTARPASWALTGAMGTPRSGATVTLLADGKVLVAGGGDGVTGVDTGSAELYDPRTGSWTATGAMVTPREAAAATLLPDGKVLVAGGGQQMAEHTWLASAELYDPRTGSWTATGTMLIPRGNATATLLLDGKVLVVGGDTDSGSGMSPSAELYDPSTASWSATGVMGTPRNGGTATLLPNGMVLVAGGYTPHEASGNNAGYSSPSASVELYDPASGTWTATGTMGTPRGGGIATLLPDGKVLVVGGVDSGSRSLASAEVFDSGTGTWTATGDMLASVAGTATLLRNGDVLVAGGWVVKPGSGGGLPTAERSHFAELYDPGSGTWTATASIPTSCGGGPATLLRDGVVLVAGGSVGTSSCLYDPGSP
jgi:N-acetylneuraminic acid mutarotase